MMLYWPKAEHFISFGLSNFVQILLACAINTYNGTKNRISNFKCICNGNKKYTTGTWTYYTDLCIQTIFPLLLLTVQVQNKICNSLLTIFTKSWQNLNKIRWSELHKIWIVLIKKLHIMLTNSDISLAPFWKRFCMWNK